ncbi:MAG: hypothetical protein LBM73_00105 [Candidatus Nomurabacteria bacterium]|jgi:hypothetical protein|nr:hypothetical protein [Candidatus Nomurabacteria bacterium]
MADSELVDVLMPPGFQPSGIVKTRNAAYRDGDWIGTFNLWIVAREPEPAIIYQMRAPDSSWAPNKLDVSAGGHYTAGESGLDGLREAREELGKNYAKSAVKYLGRRLFVGQNTNGTSRNNVASLYLIEDNQPLNSYIQARAEVYALFALPVKQLLRLWRDPGYEFLARGLTAAGEPIEMTIRQTSFPPNPDDYHRRMCDLIRRYLAGECELNY